MKPNFIFLTFLSIVFSFLMSGCSKEEAEPEPAEQAIGNYEGTLYSEGVDGVSQSYDLTNATIKSQFSVSFNVAKKSATTVTVVMTLVQKDSTGQSQTYNQTYDSIELRKLTTGGYEMYYNGADYGQIVNGILTLQESYNDTDDNGKTITVNIKITASKKNN